MLKGILQKSFYAVLVGIFLLNAGFLANAATVDELKNQRDRLSARLDEINKQIQSLQGQISANQKQQASLKNELGIFDAQIRSTELAIEAKEAQIEDTNLQIAELSRQVGIREEELLDKRGNLAQLVSALHRLDDTSSVQLVLGTGSFSSILDQVEYTGQIQSKVYETVKNIKEVKAELEKQKSERERHAEELGKLKSNLQTQENALLAQRGDRQKILTQTKGLESNYKKLLTASQKEEEELAKEIQNLDDDVRRLLGDRSIQPQKGALIRPMAGVTTQKYGCQSSRVLGPLCHNGIDIAAPAGTPIYAAGNGEVTACDSSNAAYGIWCTVKHKLETKTGERCVVSLYAHMKSFVVKPGQTVKQGDLIGYEGNTGLTTRLLYGPHRGFHIHFTIFDCEGFGIAQGKQTKAYGNYRVPYGYTYDPVTFF